MEDIVRPSNEGIYFEYCPLESSEDKNELGPTLDTADKITPCIECALDQPKGKIRLRDISIKEIAVLENTLANPLQLVPKLPSSVRELLDNAGDC